MSDTQINIRDSKTGETITMKVFDLGDGTYVCDCWLLGLLISGGVSWQILQ